MDAGVHVDTVRTAVRQRLRILLAVPRTSILRDVKDLENCWSARPAARSKDQMSMVVARRVQLAAAITSCASVRAKAEDIVAGLPHRSRASTDPNAALSGRG